MRGTITAALVTMSLALLGCQVEGTVTHVAATVDGAGITVTGRAIVEVTVGGTGDRARAAAPRPEALTTEDARELGYDRAFARSRRATMKRERREAPGRIRRNAVAGGLLAFSGCAAIGFLASRRRRSAPSDLS